MIKLSELSIYPLKSCAGISLTQASLSPFGLESDRRWMLVDSLGEMLTQRKLARMCLIQSQLNKDNLTLSAADMPDLNVPLVSNSVITNTQATVWEDTCNAYDYGEEAAIWFSRFLNTPARLVYFPDDEFRQVDLSYARQGDKTAFSDGFPYLLISQASLDDLNSRLDTPVEMKRFRPNLVVSGCDAYAEDEWKRIRIGTIEFRLVKSCSRCVIPSINPATAEKTADPIRTLARYRMKEKNIYFGQNLIAEGTGTIELGMPVQILE